jgi:hypothetical protein
MDGLINIVSSPLSLQLTAGENADRFWFSLKHKGCNLAGFSLTITLGEDYKAGASVDLYIDSCVNNPANTTATTAGFKMQSTWDGIVVDSDATEGAMLSSQLRQLFQRL